MTERATPAPASRPRLLVSRCLELDPCRYDGAVVPEPLVSALVRHVEVVPICPEVAIGLGVPRDPIRVVVASDGSRRLVQPSTGRDLTSAMIEFRRTFLEGHSPIDGALLKAKSPSCGIRNVKQFASAASEEPVDASVGLFAEAMLRVEGQAAADELELADLDARDHFLTRVFAHARLRAARAQGTLSALMRFHAEHKLLLLAHHEPALRELGPWIANPDGRSLDALWNRYEPKARGALAHPAGRGARVNGLLHALGYFRDSISSEERARLLDTIQRFQGGEIGVWTPIAALRETIERVGEPYLSSQAFFWPYPDELRPS